MLHMDEYSPRRRCCGTMLFTTRHSPQTKSPYRCDEHGHSRHHAKWPANEAHVRTLVRNALLQGSSEEAAALLENADVISGVVDDHYQQILRKILETFQSKLLDCSARH